MQNDPQYDKLAELVDQEATLETSADVAEYEIKCAFLKLEKARLDATIMELLAMEERGEPVDSEFIGRLFKRRQMIHQSLVQESTEAVDRVMDSVLS